jgi:hypothetical protein
LKDYDGLLAIDNDNSSEYSLSINMENLVLDKFVSMNRDNTIALPKTIDIDSLNYRINVMINKSIQYDKISIRCNNMSIINTSTIKVNDLSIICTDSSINTLDLNIFDRTDK